MGDVFRVAEEAMPFPAWPDGYPGLERRSALVCGHRMSYVTGGSGPAVILLHGLGSDNSTWRKVLPALAAHYRVFAVDLFGCGASDNPDIALTIEAMAHYLRLFMDVVGIQRAHLIGHSLGGGVAMQTLHFSPDRVDRLVLVDSGGLGRDVHWLLRISTLPGAHQIIGLMSHPRSGVIGLLRKLEQRNMHKQADGYEAMIPAVLHKLHELDSRRSFLRMVRAIGSLGGQTVSALPHLPKHEETPFLLIWGAADPIIPLSHGQVATALLPHAHLAIVPDCYHQPHLEVPEEFLRLTREFLCAEVWPPVATPVVAPPQSTAPRPKLPWKWIAPAAVALTGIPTGIGVAVTVMLRKRMQVAG